VARGKAVISKNARRVKLYNIAVLTVKRQIVLSIKENAINVQLKYLTRLYSNNLHKMENVPFVS